MSYRVDAEKTYHVAENGTVVASTGSNKQKHKYFVKICLQQNYTMHQMHSTLRHSSRSIILVFIFHVFCLTSS